MMYIVVRLCATLGVFVRDLVFRDIAFVEVIVIGPDEIISTTTIIVDLAGAIEHAFYNMRKVFWKVARNVCG